MTTYKLQLTIRLEDGDTRLESELIALVEKRLKASPISPPFAALWVEGEPSTDRKLQEAYGLLEQEYAKTIKDFAEECIREVRDAEVTDREQFFDRLHESLDGHHDVIYTSAAQSVVHVSRNAGAFVDAFGSEGLVKDGSINWSGMAYAAMECDVLEYLDHVGFDVNDDETFEQPDDDDEATVPGETP